MFSVLFLFLFSFNVSSKDVRIEVKGTWKQPSLISMASEFLHETKYRTFWEIFDQRLDGEDLIGGVRSLLREGDQKLFEYTMSIHYFAPLLNTFQQIGENKLLSYEGGENFDNFVDCGEDKIFSNFEDLEKFLSSNPSSEEETETYPFDHVYPKKDTQITCVLYGLVENEDVRKIHNFLKERSGVKYIFRHFYWMDVSRRDHFTSDSYTELDSIQGYGMALKIKNQEYRTMDPKNRPKAQAPSEFAGIRFDYMIEKYPDLDFKLNLLREHLVKELFDLGGELKAWDIQDIGFSTSQVISESDDPLATLQEVSTNFPNHVTSIIEAAKSGKSKKSPESFKNDLKHTSEKLGVSDDDTGVRLIFNNKEVDLEMTTIFTLRDLIKDDLESFNKMKTFESQLPFTDDDEMESFSQMMIGKDGPPTEPIFDIISFPQIQWMNDIENDQRYQNLDSSVRSILRPPHYGRQPIPKRNMFQFVYLVDPSTTEGCEMIAKAREVLNYGAPFRVGFVLYPFSQAEQASLSQRFDVNVLGEVLESSETNDEDDEPTIGEKLLTVMGYIRDKSGTEKMFDFVLFFRNFLKTNGVISEEELRSEFGRHAPSGLKYDDVIFDKDNFEKYSAMILQDTYLMLDQRNIPKHLEKPIVLMNGRLIQNSDSSQLDFGNLLKTHLNEEIERMKSLVDKRVITNSDRDIFLKMIEFHQEIEEENRVGRVFERFNEQVFATPEWKSYEGNDIHRIIPPLNFISGVNIKEEKKLIPYSHILCATNDDSDDQEFRRKSLETIHDSLRYFKSHKEGQIGIMFSEVESNGEISEFSLKMWKFLLEDGGSYDGSSLYEYVDNLEFGKDDDLESIREAVESGMKFCKTHYSESRLYLSSHGRIIDDASEFKTEDYETLEKYLSSLKLWKVYEFFEKYSLGEVCQNLYVYYSSLILRLNSDSSMKKSGNDASSNLPNFSDVEPTFRFKDQDVDSNNVVVDNKKLSPEVHLIIDPLSSLAPKWSTIVRVLFAEFFKFDVSVYLTPKSGISTLPLQSWYRYVLSPSLSSSSDDNNRPSCFFSGLPDRYILTVTPDEPEGWLLESTYSEYDLDNLNLELMEEGVTTEIRYQLENIVYTGQTQDTTTTTAPRGLQFELVEAGTGKVVDDTLVMANYGYFQFKANPGVFNFRIAGIRANAIYRLSRVDLGDRLVYELDQKRLSDEEYEQHTVSVYVNHFDGAEIKVKVQRRPGMGNVELFDDTPLPGESEKMGLFTRLFGGKSENSKKKDEKEVINIFSVASGHLYERLLRIMMRSIMEHTVDKRVHFYIIKNYLSPQFKEYLPYISKEYGFEYSLITYKWPTWLHKQTNKIRIIWAYKVLFLDVLFPLEVKKIIYVDADQVTRADMSELWEMNLRKKVIALTPFCNDKPEMDGYAFWKGGYWKNHLGGKPYHISALYVVDVENFRKRYAGDQYRVVYSNLAKDPNSLANLDQDLPNFVQHMIPIHSLPQEWLWCETWCSDKSKSKAKTIDLCNNPMTKEHKVTQAKRIVDEWITYDEEMTQVVKKLQEDFGIIEK